jgi:hypothetical protein
MALVFPKRWQSLQLEGSATQIDFTNDGSLMAVALAGGDGGGSAPCIEVYRTEDGSRVAAYGQGGYAGRGVAFTGDNLHFGVEDAKHKVVLMRVPAAGGEPARVAEYDSDEAVTALARSRDGVFLAVLGAGAEVWELQLGEVVRNKEGANRDRPVRACFSPDSRYLYLYGTVAGQVVALDVAEDEVAHQMPAPQPFGGAVSVSPSGEYLYVVGENASGAFLYRVPAGERLLPQQYGEGMGQTMPGAFSSDSSALLHPTDRVRLPSGKTEFLPIAGPGEGIAMASAWEAPVVAYSNYNGDLFWIRYEVG